MSNKIKGLRIWNSKEGFHGQCDLDCDYIGTDEDGKIKFYVINGAWYGTLDIAKKEIYIEFTKTTTTYYKVEFVYEDGSVS